MTKARAAKVERTTRAGAPATDIALGPGLHAATIDLESKGRFAFEYRRGSARATLAASPPAPAEECRKARRIVLVTDTPEGVVILGTLQTQPSVEGKRETMRLDAKEAELAAEKAPVLRVGKTMLVLDESGAIRMVGEGVALRAGKAVKVLAANVELP